MYMHGQQCDRCIRARCDECGEKELGPCIIPIRGQESGASLQFWVGRAQNGGGLGEWVLWSADGSVLGKLVMSTLKVGTSRLTGLSASVWSLQFTRFARGDVPIQSWNSVTPALPRIDYKMTVENGENCATQKVTYHPDPKGEVGCVKTVESANGGQRHGIQLEFDAEGQEVRREYYFQGKRCHYFGSRDIDPKRFVLYHPDTMRKVDWGMANHEDIAFAYTFSEKDFLHPSEITLPDTANSCPFTFDVWGEIVY